MKKKLLMCFATVFCILSLTACGSEQTANSFMTKDEAKEQAEYICENMGNLQMMLAANGVTMSDWMTMNGLNPADYPADINGMDSWDSAAEDFGNFVSVIKDETEVTISDKEAVVDVKIQGDKVYKGNKTRTATVEIVYTENGYDSITVSTDYDMSELVVNAALNTVLGMGTVFVVLILISLIIYCFNFIPRIQAAFAKKKAAPGETAQTGSAASAPAAQPAAKEDVDDLELIAVIAAAVAASEGAASADGYVVRSIIRRA